jgi:hypothetical protein
MFYNGHIGTMTKSPTPADGILFSLPLIPITDMILSALAPVLSQQLTTAATGRPEKSYSFLSSPIASRWRTELHLPRVILNLVPTAPPLPIPGILSSFLSPYEMVL